LERRARVSINAYCNRMRLAGFRPQSVTARLSCLRSFEKYIAPTALMEATRFDIEAYLARPLAPESRRAYSCHLRAFYRWALDEGLVEEDPTLRLPAVRIPRASPRPVSHEDLNTAVMHAGQRMRAWLLLMALGGLRCIEVAAVRPEDLTVTSAGPLLFLRECKGGGTGTMPAHAGIVAALSALPVRAGAWWSCSAHHVSIEVNRYLREVGVKATSHQLRHWAGTEWYRASGHDLLATAQLLRHASVQTTQIYAQLDPVRPAEVVALVRPPAPSGEDLRAARAG
jgi:integrase/recombinase XerD